MSSKFPTPSAISTASSIDTDDSCSVCGCSCTEEDSTNSGGEEEDEEGDDDDETRCQTCMLQRKAANQLLLQQQQQQQHHRQQQHPTSGPSTAVDIEVDAIYQQPGTSTSFDHHHHHHHHQHHPQHYAHHQQQQQQPNYYHGRSESKKFIKNGGKVPPPIDMTAAQKFLPSQHQHPGDSPLTPDYVPTPPPPPNCSKLAAFHELRRHQAECSSSSDNDTPNNGPTTSSQQQQPHSYCECIDYHHHQHHHHHQSHGHNRSYKPVHLDLQLNEPRSTSEKSKFNFVFDPKVAGPSCSSSHHHPGASEQVNKISPDNVSGATYANAMANSPSSQFSSQQSLSGENTTTTTTTSEATVEGGLKSKRFRALVHPLDRSIAGIFTLTIFFTVLALLTGAPIVLCLFLLLPFTYGLKRLFQCRCTASMPNHEPVSSIDSFWLSSGHITHCLLYLDKGLSIEQLRDVISTRLLSKPELSRFKSKLILKGLCKSPYWKYEEEFNTIEEHVIRDEPITSKRALRQRLVELMAESLPADKPMWQVRYAVATYCNQVVLIVRVHQSLSQAGLISILTHYLSDSVPAMNNAKPRFGGATLSINIFRAIIVGPLTFFLWILWAFTRRRNNYLTKSKDARSIHWITLDLPRVYRIKQVTRSTLNDVLLSSIAGSIRAYLTTRTNIENPPDLTVSIPIDIKPATPIDNNLVGVNYVLTTSPIPTNTEGAIPRLWEVRHLMEELKTSADTAVMYGAHYLLNRILPRPLYRMLINLVNRNSSIYVSNIQGPESPLSIGSHRLIKAYYFLSPPSYCSIVYNIFTANDKLYIAISSQSKLIPNARTLSKLFCSQIDVLHTLLSKRRVPGESKRSKRPMNLIISDFQQQFYSQIPNNMENLSTELSNKLHDIQDELGRLSEACDMGEPDVAQRCEELKQEFSALLFQMRRRKSLADYGNNIMINIENEDDDDDDNDGELRPPPRRFSVVSIGRRTSIVTNLPSSSRVTPPILSRRSMTTSPEPPSSPEMAFKLETEC